jgi:hypothetical protein
LPEISRFYGIVIRMFTRDHPPPHFHVSHGERHGRIAIATGEAIDGDLPIGVRRRVRRWGRLHRRELEANWRRAQAWKPLRRIDPLP